MFTVYFFGIVSLISGLTGNGHRTLAGSVSCSMLVSYVFLQSLEELVATGVEVMFSFLFVLFE
jgi:hypothetical protein